MSEKPPSENAEARDHRQMAAQARSGLPPHHIRYADESGMQPGRPEARHRSVGCEQQRLHHGLLHR